MTPYVILGGLLLCCLLVLRWDARRRRQEQLRRDREYIKKMFGDKETKT